MNSNGPNGTKSRGVFVPFPVLGIVVAIGGPLILMGYGVYSLNDSVEKLSVAVHELTEAVSEGKVDRREFKIRLDDLERRVGGNP